jgi:hypothetical protein
MADYDPKSKRSIARAAARQTQAATLMRMPLPARRETAAVVTREQAKPNTRATMNWTEVEFGGAKAKGILDVQFLSKPDIDTCPICHQLYKREFSDTIDCGPRLFVSCACGGISVPVDPESPTYVEDALRKVADGRQVKVEPSAEQWAKKAQPITEVFPELAVQVPFEPTKPSLLIAEPPKKADKVKAAALKTKMLWGSLKGKTLGEIMEIGGGPAYLRDLIKLHGKHLGQQLAEAIGLVLKEG